MRLWLACCASTLLAQAPVLTKTALLGQFDPATDADFVEVAPGQRLRRETAAAFEKMRAAAARDGFTLKPLSTTRNFVRQKEIWERKWNASTLPPAERARFILRYSSMPGTSRHHWGTDLDLNSLNFRAWEQQPELQKLHAWLTRRGPEFGFCQPYTAKGPHRPAGYEEEKWHWSYVPLAREFLKQHRSTVTTSDLNGFRGAETAREVRALEDYVNGIDPSCR